MQKRRNRCTKTKYLTNQEDSNENIIIELDEIEKVDESRWKLNNAMSINMPLI